MDFPAINIDALALMEGAIVDEYSYFFAKRYTHYLQQVIVAENNLKNNYT